MNLKIEEDLFSSFGFCRDRIDYKLREKVSIEKMMLKIQDRKCNYF